MSEPSLLETIQKGIMEEVPLVGQYLWLSLDANADARESLRFLKERVDGERVVVGIGQTLVSRLDHKLEGLRQFPVLKNTLVDIPNTASDLWIWLRGDDRGELLHQRRSILEGLEACIDEQTIVDAFRYKTGLDLTGYEDGTENPSGDDAIDAAFVKSDDSGMRGSSFVAVQKWVHDMDAFMNNSSEARDHIIGRSIESNEELEDAPDSAHVKRAEQEAYEPNAYMLRRSMPWSQEEKMGLVFVAFGKSYDAFEKVLTRMSGAEDGLPDALFQFSQPLDGSYYWCPPISGGQLNLSALGV